MDKRNPFYVTIPINNEPVKEVLSIESKIPDGTIKPLEILDTLAPYELLDHTSLFYTDNHKPYIYGRALAPSFFGYSHYTTLTVANLKTGLQAGVSYENNKFYDRIIERRSEMAGANSKAYRALDYAVFDIVTMEWCYMYDIANLISFVDQYKAERGMAKEVGKYVAQPGTVSDVLDDPILREAVDMARNFLKTVTFVDKVAATRLSKLGRYVYMSKQQYLGGSFGVIRPAFKAAITKANVAASLNGMTYNTEVGTEANLCLVNSDMQIGDHELWFDLYAAVHTATHVRTAVGTLIKAINDSPSHQLVRNFHAGVKKTLDRDYSLVCPALEENDEYPVAGDLLIANKLRYLPQPTYIESTDDWDTFGLFDTTNLYIPFGAYSPSMSFEEIMQYGIWAISAGNASPSTAYSLTIDAITGERLAAPLDSSTLTYMLTETSDDHFGAQSTPPLLNVDEITADRLHDNQQIMRQFDLPFLIGYTTPSVGPDDEPYMLENVKSGMYYALLDTAQTRVWIRKIINERISEV